MIKRLIQKLMRGAEASAPTPVPMDATGAAQAATPVSPPPAPRPPVAAADTPEPARKRARPRPRVETDAGPAAAATPATLAPLMPPPELALAELHAADGIRREIPASVHGIDPRLLDDRAVKVVRTLQAAGHEAYIVGGAVRDLLVGRAPKDFDVATDATPEQVKAQFRRAFIIGRRFRIVHVVHGRGRDHEVVEVSTFRAQVDAADAMQVGGNEKTSRAELAGSSHAVDASGRVLRDNVWGPQVEDAARRDFTVNAMYYDPTTQRVIDYHHGFEDLRAKRLSLIGDPGLRYREDPVRILRAVRFEAKLGFRPDAACEGPIAECAPLLANIPASRLFDEMIKLLQTGHARASLVALERHGLHRGVFPVLDAVFDPARSTPARRDFIDRALADTDARVAEGKPVAPSYLLACLLWHDVLQAWHAAQAAGKSHVPALHEAVDAVFEARIGDVSGRGKLGADMREIWLMQPRFERRTPSTARALVEQPRFRAAFDFLRLRAECGEVATELADWWEDYSLGGEDEREALLLAVKPPARRVASKPAPARGAVAEPAVGAEADAAEDDGEEGADDDLSLSQDSDAPAAAKKRRRRRRRRPSAGGQGAGADAAAPSPTNDDA